MSKNASTAAAKAPAAAKKHRAPLSLSATWFTHANKDVEETSGGAKVTTASAADTEGTMTGDPVQAGFLIRVGLKVPGGNMTTVECLMDTAGTTLWAVEGTTTNAHDAKLTHVMPYGDSTQARLHLVPGTEVSLIEGPNNTAVTISSAHLVGLGNLFKTVGGRLVARPDEIRGGVIGFIRKGSTGIINHLKKVGTNLNRGDVDTTTRIPSIFEAVRTTFGNGIITFHFTPYAFKDKATVTFGGYPNGLTANDFTWINVEQSVMDGKSAGGANTLMYENHWTFKCGMKLGNAVIAQSCDVLLDSGSPCIELPGTVFKEYEKEVKKSCPSMKTFSSKLSGTFTILKNEAAMLPSLKLHIGNQDFEIKGDAQIWPVALNAGVAIPADRVLLRVKKLPAHHTMALVGLPSCMFLVPFIERESALLITDHD